MDMERLHRLLHSPGFHAVLSHNGFMGMDYETLSNLEVCVCCMPAPLPLALPMSSQPSFLFPSPTLPSSLTHQSPSLNPHTQSLLVRENTPKRERAMFVLAHRT